MPDDPSQQTAGLTQIRPPTLSQTTGRQPVGERPPSSTGTQLSAHGVGETVLGRWVKQQLGPFNLPEGAVLSLTSSLSSHLELMPTTTIGGDGQFEHAKVRFQMKPGMPRSAAERDIRVVERHCQPSPKSDVAKHVAVLRARTKSANQDQSEARFAAEVMVNDLAKYPLDVVEYACDYWVNGGKDAKWFPSWPELKEICDRRMQPRRALLKGLRWVVAGEPENSM